MAENGGGVSLWGLGLAATGGLLVWSAINDPPGGPLGVLRELLAGRRPAPGDQPALWTPPGPDASGTPDRDPGSGSSPQGDSRGIAVVRAAEKYLGKPYKFATTGPNTFDCSGLVLRAYSDALGIKLPHYSDAIMRKAKIIPASEARAGDVVGWPSPAKYSHIGIVVSPGRSIEAASPAGNPVKYYNAMRRAAGGSPTFGRLL